MWVLFSILSAWTWSTSDYFSKRALENKEADEISLIGFRYWISIPLLIPIFFLIPFPHISSLFWEIHLVWLPVELLAVFLYIRAIKISPLSLTLPLLSLTPMFLLFTSYVILGETASSRAILGIILIVVGSYLLYFEQKRGLLAPFKRFIQEKGSILMVIVAFLYSLTSVFGKVLISNSSPLFFSAYYPIVMSLVTAPIVFSRPQKRLFLKGRFLILSGVFFSLMILFHMLALSQAKVSYMIALKRLSGVFGVIYGFTFYKEKLELRLPASLIMVIGAFLISTG